MCSTRFLKIITLLLGLGTVEAAAQDFNYTGFVEHSWQPVIVTTGTINLSSATLENFKVDIASAAGHALAVSSGPVDAGTIRVVIADDQPLVSTLRVIKATGTVTQTRVFIDTSSVNILPQNDERLSLECQSKCTNTGTIYIKLGIGPATDVHYPIEACSTWEPPSQLNFTGELHGISSTNGQDFRCIEY